MEETAENLFAEGKKLCEGGQQNEGIAKLRLVVQMKPEWADAHRFLAFVLHRQNDIGSGSAIAEYQSSLIMEPDDAWTYYGLGRAYSPKKEWAASIDHYRLALNADAYSTKVHLGLGGATANLAKKQKRRSLWEESRQSFQQVLLSEPRNPKALAGLANSEWHLGNRLLAVDLARKTTDADETYKFGGVYLLRFQIASGHLVHAWATFNKMIHVKDLRC